MPASRPPSRAERPGPLPRPDAALCDPARLAALRATELLDAPAAQSLDRLSRLAARLLGVPTALVSLVDADRQFFASCVGVAEPWASARGTPLSHSFCQYVVASAAPLVVVDAREHPELRDNLAVPVMGVVAYAGMPLTTADGHVLGTLCVVDEVPRAWSDEEIATLEDLARAATAEIELRVASRAAAEASRTLGELLDATTELVCAADAEGRVTYVNRAWKAAMGYAHREAVGLRAIDLVAPEHRGRFLDVARRLAVGEPVEAFEAVLVARDGRRVVCRGRAAAQMVDDPASPTGRRCVGTRAVYRDVTAERQADATRARLVATLEASPDFVGMTDANGHAVFVNRAGKRLLGLAEDVDVAAITAASLHPPAAAARLAAEAIPAAVRDGVWEGETLLRGAGGEEIPVAAALVAHPSTRPGEGPYFLSAVMRDLRGPRRAEAALRESEARFRSILETVHAAAVCLDGAGRVSFINDAFLALTGWTRDDVLGADYFGRFVPDAEGARERFVRAAADASAVSPHEEHDVLTRTGERRTVAWAHAVLTDAAGAVVGRASIGQDVSERVRIAKLKGELVAVASHELRTPLTAIKGALDLLRHAVAGRGAAAAEQRLVDIAAKNAGRLVRLVNDLLDVERIESGTAMVRPASVCVATLLGAAVDGLGAVAREAGVALAVDGAEGTAEGCALVAWADADRVTQVLVNLVANAIKFTPAGGAVTLTAAADPDADGMLRLSVRDDGRGIPAEKLATIFEPFEQVDASDSREKGGAGLGLAICRAIVRQHGGRIWAESAGAGVGSTISFTLPTAERGAPGPELAAA